MDVWSLSYDHISCGKVNANKVNVKVNVNKVNVKVNDIYSVHSHYKETTKEVPRPEAAAPLLWWRPTAATFVVAMNRVDVVVDLVDIDLVDVDLVDIDLHVDFVDVGLNVEVSNC